MFFEKTMCLIVKRLTKAMDTAYSVETAEYATKEDSAGPEKLNTLPTQKPPGDTNEKTFHDPFGGSHRCIALQGTPGAGGLSC
jgi:hypothetical protein